MALSGQDAPVMHLESMLVPAFSRTLRLAVLTLLLASLPAPLLLMGSPYKDDAERVLQALRRFTYGPRIGDVERVQRLGLRRWFDQQVDAAYLADNDCERRVRPWAAKTDVAGLAAEKVMRAIYSERQLKEIMVDFWFNHFNVDARKVNAQLAEYERGVIRQHALGSFPDLLRAVAHSPAMLTYLDNSRSKGADSPAARNAIRHGNPPPNLNENYARELLELHTLGVDGGYSQHDVVEVARILTGWTTAGDAFKFDANNHDDGEKVVLGRHFPFSGQDEGEKLLAWLAVHPMTAEHLAMKLCRRFVSDNPPRALVYRVSAVFSGSGGDIKTTLREIFTASEVYAGGVRDAKTKTPLEDVVSSVRAVRGDVQNPALLVGQIEQLGEPLYRCTPPTGYPDTAGAWINSGTLQHRLDFADRLCHGQMGVRVLGMTQVATKDPRRWASQLIGDILGREASTSTRNAIAGVAPTNAAPTEATVENVLTLILGAPEFQSR